MVGTLVSDTVAASGASPKPSVERRVTLRLQPAVNTVYRFETADGLPASGIVWNISTTGICILLPEAQPIGAVLTGSIGTTGGDHTHAIALKIVHSRRLEAGDYALGARFERPLTDDELKPFVADE